MQIVGLPRTMPVVWPIVRMRDVCVLNYGKALTSETRRAGNIPVYGSNGQTGLHNIALGEGPTVILGRKGQGNLGVKWCEGPFWVIDTAYYTKFLPGLAPRYFYFFTDFVGLNHLKDGTSNPSLSRDTFYAQPIPLPPYADQVAIAAALASYDDKIELNRRKNETLEAIAHAIFRDWFVDFGPVRRKLAGATDPVDIMGALTPDPALAAKQAALFPGSLDGDELPTGWFFSRLADVTSQLRRGISPKYVAESGVTVLNQKCIRDGQVSFGPARLHDAEKRSVDGRTLVDGDILVNSTGVGTLGRVAQIWGVAKPVIVDSHVTVVRANETVSSIYLGLAVRFSEAQIELLGEGSTGQTELSRERLGQLPILLPPRPIIDAFDDACGPFTQLVQSNRAQAVTLAETRDYLLPRLMSGAVRVGAAEAAVLEAAQ